MAIHSDAFSFHRKLPMTSPIFEKVSCLKDFERRRNKRISRVINRVVNRVVDWVVSRVVKMIHSLLGSGGLNLLEEEFKHVVTS